MNILVTAIGSFSADCVINSLRKAEHTVVGCDIHPPKWHAVSKDCNWVYQAPYATKESEYIQFLLDISLKHDIEYLFPLTDLEIDVLDQNRTIFKQNGIVLCMPSSQTLAIARNKYVLYKTFKHDDLVPSISTYLSGEVPMTLLPTIAKPYNGRSSEGLLRISTVKELEEISKKSGYIFQEMIEGPVFTVDYIRNSYTNKDFSIAREELIRTKNGAGTTVRMSNDILLKQLVSHIGNTIHVNGCINMEFIQSKGKYYLIDINPRFSAGVAFSRMVGYNMVLNHLNCFIAQDIQDGILYQEQIITKRYWEEIL
ncbi:MAG: ATP-grasp domain-containing protein [Bacteroides sp.]|jgi:carbamoyl-phosphate synthase large subunit|uniref:ATP-grasp domain-containing protein n=1 Tax=Bacteroides TaxID=816 RepID=UPI0025BD4705|nr:ATP-grasp domain-containing protein [Bacteroides sp.]MBS6240064.1 ATP-grasp domain-containing protein [Bacteroides sp.]